MIFLLDTNINYTSLWIIIAITSRVWIIYLLIGLLSKNLPVFRSTPSTQEIGLQNHCKGNCFSNPRFELGTPVYMDEKKSRAWAQQTVDRISVQTIICLNSDSELLFLEEIVVVTSTQPRYFPQLTNSNQKTLLEFGN